MVKEKITESDKKILNLLIENSRKSYRQLAKDARVSIATIGNRLKKLEKNNIIRKYSTLVRYRELGYDFHVIINVKVAHGHTEKLEKKMFNSPNIESIYDLTGEFDVMLVARFKNRKALDKYLKQLQSYEFIERTETQLILKTLKNNPILIE